MNLEINYEASDEELSMVLDDSTLLKVTLGARKELILNNAFKELENDDNELYTVLRKVARELFALTDT